MDGGGVTMYRNSRRTLLRGASVIALTIAVTGTSVHAQSPQAGSRQQNTRVETLDMIVVEGTNDPVEVRRESPTTKLVYGRTELERFNETTVGDILRKLPGVIFAGNPAENSDVRLRGFEKGYTEFLIDGQRTLGGGAERQMQLDLLPAEMIERIEIIHNPTADISGGIAGSINIVLREIGTKPGGGMRIADIHANSSDRPQVAAQWTDRYGPISYLFSGSVGNRKLVNDKHTDIQTFNSAGKRTAWSWQDEKSSDDIRDYNLAPRLQWKPTERDTFSLNAFLFKTDQATAVRTEKGKFGVPATGSNPAFDGYTTENTDKNREVHRVQGVWRRVLSLGDAEWKLTTQQSTETKDKSAEEFNAARVRTKTSTEDGTKKDQENSLAGRWWATLDNHLVSIGTEIAERSRNDIKTRTENGVSKAAGLGDTFDIGERKYVLWAQDVWKIQPDHVLTPGIRLEKVITESTDGVGQVRSGEILVNNPSLHYVWHLDPLHNFRASIAKSVKPPNFDQLSSVVISASGVNSSTNPDKTGNPDLKPERALGIEAGIERFLPTKAGVVGLTYFQRDIKDKIDTQVTLDPNGRWIERSYNVGDFFVRGVELDFKARMDLLGLPSLTLLGNGSRMESTYLSSDAKNKKDPAWVYNIGFVYDVEPWNLSFGGNFNAIDRKIKQNDATKFDVEGSQRRLDWFAAYRPTKTTALKLNVAEKRVKKHDIDAYDTKGNVTLTREKEIVSRSIMVALEVKW